MALPDAAVLIQKRNAKLSHSPRHARGGHGRGGMVCKRDDPWRDGCDGSSGSRRCGCRDGEFFFFFDGDDVGDDVGDVDDEIVGGRIVDASFFRVVRRRRFSVFAFAAATQAAPPP